MRWIARLSVLAVVTPLVFSSPAYADDPVPFGADSAFQWTDGLSASVLTVTRFTPSDSATVIPAGDVAVRIVVRVTNATSAVFDVSGTMLTVRSGPDGTQDAAIVDLGNDITLGLEGSVAAGRAATASYGFAVPADELDLIDVEVSPDYDYDAAIFEGEAA